MITLAFSEPPTGWLQNLIMNGDILQVDEFELSYERLSDNRIAYEITITLEQDLVCPRNDDGLVQIHWGGQTYACHMDWDRLASRTIIGIQFEIS